MKTIAIALTIATLAACSSCATLKEEGKALAGDVVDCTTQHARTLTEQFAPLVDSLLRNATGADGSIDWAPVKQASSKFGLDTGGCVLATVIARHTQPRASADPSAPQVSPLEADPAKLLAGYGVLRAELFPGKTFKTELGTL